MSKEDDYRKNAAETIELASRAVSTTDKGHLLALAEKWLDLADRAHRLTKRFGAIHRDHPLIDQTRRANRRGLAALRSRSCDRARSANCDPHHRKGPAVASGCMAS